jgi:hypothetical protein
MGSATESLDAKNLLYTGRGKLWIEQFDVADREIAERVASSLTLVSHSEFERSLQTILEKRASETNDVAAFFAVREVGLQASYFEQYTDLVTGELNALSFGSDHGSEARIAALIRNLCKTDKERLLNHPSIGQMRAAKCRTVYLVDDFIGSGERTSLFIMSLRRDPSFVSWCSLKYLKIVCVAYSGTPSGVRRIVKTKTDPEIVIERSCPSFETMPWSRKEISSVSTLCEKYGLKTSKAYWWDGYGQTMAALVFEHGCPDNAPAILWAPHEKMRPWLPLFPNRVILSGEKSVFPVEIARRDAVLTLLDVGQKKLAMAGSLLRRGRRGQLILIVLALIAKGQRRQAGLSFATGLSEEECQRIVEKCKKWGFLTGSRRLTDRGHAELKAARKTWKVGSDVPPIGVENYYPSMLRTATRG